MKKVMVGVGLGLAAVSQAHAWNPGVQSVQSVQNAQATGVTKSHSTVVSQSRAAGTTHCRLPAGRTNGQVHCTNTQGQVVQQVQQQRIVVPQRQIQQRQAPQRQPQRLSQQNHQQALQAQRAKRKAMFVAQAKRKAVILAQQRKRAAMLEQQKRRKIQLAQQQARAAHQAAMLAAKKKRAVLLIQQKRRAMQLAQQRRQQAQNRAALLAQQKQRVTTNSKVNSRQSVHNCPLVRVARPQPVKQVVQQPRPVQRVAQQQPRRVVQPQVQPRVTFSQQVITQREAVNNFQPKEEIISRRIITTRVNPEQLANTQAVIQQAPRASSGQRFMQQSVDYHDRYRSSVGWNASQNVGAQRVKQHLTPPPVQQSVAHHEARVKQQRLQQIRAAQIAAQQQRTAAVQVKPAVSTHTSVSSQSASHARSSQRQSTVHSHAENAYAMYKG